VRHKKSALKNNTAAAAAVFGCSMQGLVLSKPQAGRKRNIGRAGRWFTRPPTGGDASCAVAEREPGRIDPAARSGAAGLARANPSRMRPGRTQQRPEELTVAPEQQPPQVSV